MNEGFDIRDLQLEVGTEIQIIIKEFIRDIQAPRLKAAARKRWMTASNEEKEKWQEEFGDMKELTK